MKQAVRGFPSTRFVDLLRLLGRCVGGFAKGPRSFDFGLTLQDWLEGLTRRTGSENVVLNLYFRKFLVVTGRELSAHILAQPPDALGFVEGRTKARAMSFLAPQALTITHGEQWRRLRRLNEDTLRVGGADARMQFIVDGVNKAFQAPVSDIDDIRDCMALTMLMVVFGFDSAPAHLVEDVQVLFEHVQNPGRRILFGWRQAKRRRRFYEALRRLWRESTESGEPSLLSTARGTSYNGSFTEEELIQQIPHWMFTFTGSGTDLLARTLGIVASRNDVYDRVHAEAMGRNSTSLASAAMRMEYLEACLLEVCRLFPSVTRTFHAAPGGDTFDGFRIPAGMEILHCFTANQRDVSRDSTANDFRPERWMEPGSNAEAMYPSLFLGGARDCPGKGLILLVCKVAIRKLIRYGRTRSQCPALSQDPLPLSYPERGLRYHLQRD